MEEKESNQNSLFEDSTDINEEILKLKQIIIGSNDILMIIQSIGFICQIIHLIFIMTILKK